MPGSRKGSRRGKTHVFPYSAIKPILSVDSDGNVTVSPLQGEQEVSPLSSSLNMDELNNLLQELRNLPIRKFEQGVGDIQDAIREQTKDFSERLGSLRLDGNYEPLLEQHRRLTEDHKQILDRLEQLSSVYSGNAQIEQGYQILIEEMRTSLRQLERLTVLTETITRLQTVSQELSESVAKFSSGERNWEKMDVVLSRQEEMMKVLSLLSNEGLKTEPLTRDMEEGIRALKDSITYRLDNIEEVQREIKREISQFSDAQRVLEDIREMVSSPSDDQHVRILSHLDNLTRDISSIPRINQDQLLAEVGELIRKMGDVSGKTGADVSSRLEGLRLAIEVQKTDLERMDEYIRARLGASSEEGVSDLFREVMEKIKILDVSSRITMIEESLRVLSEDAGVNQRSLLEKIEAVKSNVRFEPLLERLNNLENTLNHREELRKGFEGIQSSMDKDGEAIRRLQTNVDGMRVQAETSFQRQLEALSRIEMKLSSETQGSSILEYQMKLAKCEEEKSAFEKKIGSLTMEIENLRTKIGVTVGAEQIEKSKTESRLMELTKELEVAKQRADEMERELEIARRDKDIIDPRVDQLERELSDMKNSRKVEEGRVLDLEQEISGLRSRLETCSILEDQKRDLDFRVSEITDQLSQTKRDLVMKTEDLRRATMEAEEYQRRMDELRRDLENYMGKMTTYETDHATFMNLVGRIDEEIIRNEVLTDKVQHTERLGDLLNHLYRKIEEKTVKQAQQEIIITDIPRYSVYPLLDEIIKGLNMSEGSMDQVMETFASSKILAEQKMFNYYQQIQKTKEDVRVVLRDSSFMHRLRNYILADPELLTEVVNRSPETPPLVAEEVIEDLEKRPLDLSPVKVGRYVLANAFSPIIPITSDLSRLDEIAPKVASALYRVFYIKDVLNVVTTIGGQVKNISLENEIKEEFSGLGRWNESRTQILMEVGDIFKALLRLLSNIRGFVRRIGLMNVGYAYGLEMRYVLLDAFMKTFEESKIRLERVSSVFEARESLPEPYLRSLLSYVKIRGDDGDIDPRFVFKVDQMRRKLILGHQPFVFSSTFAADIESDGPYQYDLVGPMTRIFTPRDTNKVVGDNLDEMVSELDRGKDICALALGPSGAGKTSTLLYFRGNPSMNIPPQNGAIPVMLSKISKDYIRAEVKALEMTSSYFPGAGADSYWKDYEVYSGAVNFDRMDSEWVSQADIEIDVMDYGALQGVSGVCEIPKPYAEMQRVRRGFGKLSLADFLAKLIDIRLNCGTTNNPDSSRTHLFVFVHLTHRDGIKNPYLIISDLAGREKAFDCGSDAVLETLSLNRWYPELNGLIQNPVEGGIRKSTKRDIPSKDQLKDKAVERSFKATVENFLVVSRQNLNDVINEGYIKVFFGKPLEWYLIPTPSSGRETLNKDLYKHVQIMARFVIQNDYFFKKISQRFDNLDKQPEILKGILEKIGSQEKLRIYDGILRYYADMNYEDDKIMTKTPRERLRLQVKTLTGIDGAEKEHKGVVDYLNAIVVVNGIDMMLLGRPREVCGIRNLEGEFINRSLDEYSQLVMTAASIDTNYGPLMHPECMPVVCKFAGLDCLLPKNVRKDIPQSAVSRILTKGMGSSSFRPGTLFSIFLVLNASRTQPDQRVRPLYDSLEIFMKRIYEQCRGIEEKSFYVYSQNQNLLPLIIEIQKNLSVDEKSILSIYKDEILVLSEYKQRVEYRGTEEAKMLKPDDVQRLYRRSKTNWEEIRERANIVLEILSDERFPSMDSQTRSRFVEIMNGVLKIQLDVNRKNQDTIPGALAFVDELMKRGMQPMICSVSKEEEILPPTLISSWKNALYSED